LPSNDNNVSESRAERITWTTTLTILIALAVIMLGLWN